MSAAGTAPQRISVRALKHVIVLGSLVEHAELLGGVVREHLAQPLIRSVFIALVSERPNMLASLASQHLAEIICCDTSIWGTASAPAPRPPPPQHLILAKPTISEVAFYQPVHRHFGTQKSQPRTGHTRAHSLTHSLTHSRTHSRPQTHTSRGAGSEAHRHFG